MGAYPGVENSREASKNYRKRIKREAARARDELIAEKKRSPVVGAGADSL
jgi:hypothetical protein